MKLKFFAIAAAAVVMSGCLSINSYVDSSSFNNISKADITVPDAAKPVQLVVSWAQNGEDKPRLVNAITKVLAPVVEETGVYTITEDSAAPTLTFSGNNIADMGDAMKDGFVTGLTFGAAGSTVVDGYEFDISMSDMPSADKSYKHALISTIGNEEAPSPNLTAVKPIDGLNKVFQDVLLTFIKDTQAVGVAEVPFMYNPQTPIYLTVNSAP